MRKSTRNQRGRQREMVFRTWGGKRQNAGRKPARLGVTTTPHARRPLLASRFPVHVTLRVEETLPSLRSPALFRLVESSLRAGRERDDFRLVHYSVQAHHI